MKGLILKEFLGVRQYFKTLGFLFILYAVMVALMRTTIMVALFNAFLIMISVVHSFNYDDSSGWERLALTFPVSRADLVRSKYLFILMLCLASTLVTLILSLLLSLITPVTLSDMLGGAALSALGGLLLASLFTPVIYRFGVEQSRLIIVLVIMVPSLILRIFAEPLNALLPLTGATLTLFSTSATVFVLVLALASYRISRKILASREF